MFQKSIGALRSRFGSVLAIEKKGLLGISQFSSRRSFRELDAGERNGKGLPRDEHVKCVDQTYILVDEVETRGVDGFRAVLICVDPRQIDVSHCGADFDDALLEALPATADPCGENGEFHTFVYDGPMFDRPIRARRGEVVEKSGFVFCDLLPPDAADASSGGAVRDGMPSA